MTVVKDIKAREILDSRGRPTVEVDVLLSSGVCGRAGVPSGASTGAYEAHELRDGDKSRYFGKGVLSVIRNINEVIAPKLINQSLMSTDKVDELLIELDGSKNKNTLGANAILGVSLAYAKAWAQENKTPFYQSVAEEGVKNFTLPVPLMNVLNGGAHANNGIDVQEFMIVPTLGDRFSDSLRAGAEVFNVLRSLLDEKGLSTAVGDEGGFAPNLGSNQEALDLLSLSIEKAGYKLGDDIHLALDVASTEFFDGQKYQWEGQKISGTDLGDIYKSWQSKYPIVSIEDGFSEDDWDSWVNFTKTSGETLQLVGDDLFVTNSERLQIGIDKKAANALLVKVNQIGTLKETKDAIRLAHKNGFHTVMSHRSGETEDTTIADLAVGLGSHQIKTGSLCRSERTAKYNQLLRIEEELGARAEFFGKKALRH